MSTPVGVHKESYYQAKIIKWLREAYPAGTIQQTGHPGYLRHH